jgi:hypothetical protein
VSETVNQFHSRWQGCGLVVEAHIIDERSEWRTFGDKVRNLLQHALAGNSIGQLALYRHTVAAKQYFPYTHLDFCLLVSLALLKGLQSGDGEVACQACGRVSLQLKSTRNSMPHEARIW